MRKRIEQGGVVVQAVVGNHAVFFGFDLAAEVRTGCLGFALHREDHTEGEAYWIPGFKTFRSVVPEPSATTIYTTDKHPIQAMWWGDYSAKPAHEYTYKIVPVYGTPASPVLDDAKSVTLEVSTSDPARGMHGIYFNRGVAASQAYATKFGAPPPALPPAKQAEAMTWLSRGLHEALCGFISTATSPQLVVRAAAYEFTEPTVLAAFAQAHASGADVKIIYHDKPNDPAKRPEQPGNLRRSARPGHAHCRHHPTIAHNKFIVRATRAGDGTLSAEQVWTGSTNEPGRDLRPLQRGPCCPRPRRRQRLPRLLDRTVRRPHRPAPQDVGVSEQHLHRRCGGNGWSPYLVQSPHGPGSARRHCCIECSRDHEAVNFPVGVH